MRIGSQLRPDELFKIMLESDSDSQIDSLVANVVCRVDFVNAIIYDELINLVKDWYDTLQKERKKSRLIKFYSKYANRLSKFIDFLFPIIAVLIIYAWTDNYLSKHSFFDIAANTKSVLTWFTVSFVCVSLAKYIGYLIASYNFSKTKKFIEYSYLYITKGDDNKAKEAAVRNKSLVRDISINLIATIIFTILAVLWSYL